MTFDIFGGVSYNIDLRKPSGEKIVDLKLADGTPVTDDIKIKLGMNSSITAPLGLFFLPNRFRFSILLSLSKNQ